MKVHYSLWFPSLLAMRSEFDLAAADVSELSELRRAPFLEGAVTISRPGNVDVEIVGGLEAWTQNLCFDAVTKMLSGEASSINNFTGPDSLRVEPEGASVRLSGGQVGSVSYRIDELAPALVACGVRFLAKAREIKAGDDSALANLDYVETFRWPAQAALHARGLAVPPPA